MGMTTPDWRGKNAWERRLRAMGSVRTLVGPSFLCNVENPDGLTQLRSTVTWWEGSRGKAFLRCWRVAGQQAWAEKDGSPSSDVRGEIVLGLWVKIELWWAAITLLAVTRHFVNPLCFSHITFLLLSPFIALWYSGKQCTSAFIYILYSRCEIQVWSHCLQFWGW